MTETKKVHTYEVAVEKASVPLVAGEALDDFTQAFSKAGRDHIAGQLNVTSKDAGVYAVQVFGSSAVFDVYLYGKDVSDDKRSRYFAVSYKRDANGVFSFDNMTEVVRKVVFERAPSELPVTKSADDFAPGWVTTRKASADLWDGVL